jgi:hypothetical protein
MTAPIVLSVDNQDLRAIEGRLKTLYGIDGRPISQGQDAKGYHRVQGTAKLTAGVDTIDLNTSTADGRENVGFVGQSNYHGSAWSLSSANTASYRLIPISGSRFVITSSSATDTATVQFQVEGE